MSLNSFEMLIHVPLTTHKEPKSLLIISDNRENIASELAKHQFLDLNTTYIETAKSFEKLQNFQNGEFDIVILDFVPKSDKSFFAHLNRVLTNEGLISSRGDFQTLNTTSSEFRIAMPYFVNSLTKSSEVLILASKFYHPTADINLQRSDFLDGCNYYNSDIHIASFTMPNYIKKEIAGFVRN